MEADSDVSTKPQFLNLSDASNDELAILKCFQQSSSAYPPGRAVPCVQMPSPSPSARHSASSHQLYSGGRLSPEGTEVGPSTHTIANLPLDGSVDSASASAVPVSLLPSALMMPHLMPTGGFPTVSPPPPHHPHPAPFSFSSHVMMGQGYAPLSPAMLSPFPFYPHPGYPPHPQHPHHAFPVRPQYVPAVEEAVGGGAGGNDSDHGWRRGRNRGDTSKSMTAQMATGSPLVSIGSNLPQSYPQPYYYHQHHQPFAMFANDGGNSLVHGYIPACDPCLTPPIPTVRAVIPPPPLPPLHPLPPDDDLDKEILAQPLEPCRNASFEPYGQDSTDCSTASVCSSADRQPQHQHQLAEEAADVVVDRVDAVGESAEPADSSADCSSQLCFNVAEPYRDSGAVQMPLANRLSVGCVRPLCTTTTTSGASVAVAATSFPPLGVAAYLDCYSNREAAAHLCFLGDDTLCSSEQSAGNDPLPVCSTPSADSQSVDQSPSCDSRLQSSLSDIDSNVLSTDVSLLKLSVSPTSLSVPVVCVIPDPTSLAPIVATAQPKCSTAESPVITSSPPTSSSLPISSSKESPVSSCLSSVSSTATTSTSESSVGITPASGPGTSLSRAVSSAPVAAKSWASLFRTSGTVSASAPPTVATPEPQTLLLSSQNSSDSSDAAVLKKTLASFEPCFTPLGFYARGIANTSNWCYVNSIVQALLACAPFCHLIRSLPPDISTDDSSDTPITAAMTRLVREFCVPHSSTMSRSGRRDRTNSLPLPTPLSIDYVYSILTDTTFQMASGRQEDAEELLTCLLSGLQDEMALILKCDQDTAGEDTEVCVNGNQESDGDWQTVVGRNRGQVTRLAELPCTPISRIFAGQLRSCLHRSGSNTTASVQSFFSLQLDIQSEDVDSVMGALTSLARMETVDGLRCPQSGRQVEAFQQARLEHLPPVLILHLKRFLFDASADSVQKLHKRVDFPVELNLDKNLVYGTCSVKQRSYRLFAVVCHSGELSSKGHYICHAWQSHTDQWLKLDDSYVSVVQQNAVLQPKPPLVPYILFYQRR